MGFWWQITLGRGIDLLLQLSKRRREILTLFIILRKVYINQEKSTLGSWMIINCCFLIVFALKISIASKKKHRFLKKIFKKLEIQQKIEVTPNTQILKPRGKKLSHINTSRWTNQTRKKSIASSCCKRLNERWKGKVKLWLKQAGLRNPYSMSIASFVKIT